MVRIASFAHHPCPYRWWRALALFLFLSGVGQALAAADGHLVTYHDLIQTGNICPAAGSTTLSGTSIGKVTYLQVCYRNEGTSDLTVGDTSVINATGCDVVWEEVGESLPMMPDSFWSGYICFRPTAATWSFQISVMVSGDPVMTTYTHTFTASGVPMGAGAQGALALVPDGTGGPGTPGLMIQKSSAAAKEPIQVSAKVFSRSAVTPLTIPAGTWQVQGTPTNCSAFVIGSLPVSLTTDAAASQTLRVFPTAAGSFTVTFMLATNDIHSPYYSVTIFGNAVALPRLSVFNGSEQLNGDLSVIGIDDAVVGVARTIAFTLRNDDTTPLSFTTTIGVPINCTATTTTAPAAMLEPGGTAVWEMSFTTIAADWQFLPVITVSSPAARTINLGVTNRTADYRYNHPGPLPPRFEPDTGAGSHADSGGCGMGSGGVAALLALLLLVGARWRWE